MGKSFKNKMKYAVAVFVAVIAAVTVSFAFNIPGLGKYEKVKPVNGVVSIPVSKVSDGKAHFFHLTESGQDLRFFIVKGSDGQIHTAFDACDVCFKEKKGYIQQGDQMVCKNCNQKFPVNRIGAASTGGCNPSHLASRIDGSAIRITVADLKSGARFF